MSVNSFLAHQPMTLYFLDASSHLYKRVYPSIGLMASLLVCVFMGQSELYANSNIMQMMHQVACSGLLDIHGRFLHQYP